VRTKLITAAMQTVKTMQTMRTVVIKSQVTEISIEMRTNQTVQTQLMGITTGIWWAISRWVMIT